MSLQEINNFYESHEKAEDKNWLKNHQAPIKRLFDECLDIGDDIVHCLKSPKKVIKQIKDKYENPNTVKFYLQALLFLIDNYPGLADKVKRDQYYDAWQASKVVKAEQDSEGPKIPDVGLDVIDKAIVEKYGVDSMENLFIKWFMEVPTRLDFFDVKIDDKSADKYLNTEKGEVVMKKYNKTDDFYGKKNIKLSPELMVLIRKSLEKLPRENLLVFANGNPSKAVVNILKGAGLKGSMNTIRHAVASVQMSPEERVKLAKKMGHSAETSVKYKRPKPGFTRVDVPDHLVEVVQDLIKD
jgi:hypothetical protein